MSKEQLTSVSIVFQTPVGDTTPFHERNLTGVPKSKAAEIAEDFAKHRDPDSGVSPYQIYRYSDEQGERILAVDFSEVVSIFV